jgi:carbon starvation protein
MGVVDPNGGINILWPLFGMSNQMLAGIALTLATVVIAKSAKRKFLFVTAIPLAFVTFTTSWAVFEKVFSSNVKIGFLATADSWKEKIIGQELIGEKLDFANQVIFNQYLVSFLALSFLAILWVVIIDGFRTICKTKPPLKKELAERSEVGGFGAKNS